ncbi:threonine synthase [Phorcysia thermohydrogeniphila]|uniref:Threonine synthase n=1 Tax=Phorcysia thermohydrogeniphila TaxID=936138 RepID=A0A4R1GBC5_9BACT|nr:threonine synthase [Phorcysia thermohydrogeniphila]TCK03980.1 threonine synthase [Phorcysia thermohydrogeniphila]
MEKWRGIIEEFREFLPVTDKTPVVTLLEGNTPLIEANNLAEAIKPGIKLYLKFEGLNPTGSFKDRGMTVAVSKAVEEGAKAVICASTGNTSASAAAYAAKAGLKAVVLIPEGKIALGKLSQAVMYGAEVIQIKGNFDEALEIVREIGAEYPITIVNSINPYRLQGQKTAAFEICEQLGRAPDYHFIPVGNAGNITAYWMGYKEYYEAGKVDSKPKMCGWQAAGAAPIVLGHPVKNPETVATAIRIGNPASWEGAVNAAKESGGFIDMVTDEEILEAYRLVARLEGIFCEPASAASIAGVIKSAREKGMFEKGDVIVCTLTGHGLKDPDTAISMGVKPVTLPADREEIIKHLGF